MQIIKHQYIYDKNNRKKYQHSLVIQEHQFQQNKSYS